MITYNKESLNRIAQSLEKMAGADSNPPAPSEDGNVMMVTFTTISTPDGMEPVENTEFMTADKSVEEIVDAIIAGSYVYANVVFPNSEVPVGYIAVPVAYRKGTKPGPSTTVKFFANDEEYVANHVLYIKSMTIEMDDSEEYAYATFCEAEISLPV